MQACFATVMEILLGVRGSIISIRSAMIIARTKVWNGKNGRNNIEVKYQSIFGSIEL